MMTAPAQPRCRGADRARPVRRARWSSGGVLARRRPAVAVRGGPPGDL